MLRPNSSSPYAAASAPSTAFRCARLAAAVALVSVGVAGAVAPAGAQAAAQEVGRDADRDEASADQVARAYYGALIAADTAEARARSNGLLPIDFGRIDSALVADPEPMDACPTLPEIPARLREAAGSEERRRMLDSLASVLDSLHGPMRGAERCVEAPTTLVVAGHPSGRRVTVDYPTVLRLLPEGWRVDAFETGREAVPAVLTTMGSLLRDLNEALESMGGGTP